jgi:hypothetical protein
VKLFRRNQRPRELDSNTRLPADLVPRLDAFGRFEYDPQGSGIDAVGHPNAEYPLLQAAKQDPDGFLAALASATTPIGGWTSYGAMRLVWHFGLLGHEEPQPDRDTICLAGLRFVRENGASWGKLNPAEQALWNRVAGEPW